MRKYKLLKELPWLEVGTIIKYDNWFCSLNKEVQEDLINLEINSLKILEDILVYNPEQEGKWLEEIKEKSIYELKEWDEYYYIYDKIQKIIIEDNLNKKLYERDLEQWNVFLTKQEAEQELNKRRALAKIKKWIWENKIKLSDDGCVILLQEWEIITSKNTKTKWIWDIIFKNQKDAEKCLEECKKEWKILFDLI